MKKVRFSSDGEDADLEEEVAAVTTGDDGPLPAETTHASDGKATAGEDKIDEQEKALRCCCQVGCQLLDFQLKEKSEVIRGLEEQLQELKLGEGQKRDELERNSNRVDELEALLANANDAVCALTEQTRGGQDTIRELHGKLSEALDSSSRLLEKNAEENEELRKRVASLEASLQKTEQKLTNSNEEKEYYKKQQFNKEQQPTQNGSSAYATNTLNGSIGDRDDDFGHELMLVNKRKYQLEGRVRQLESELHDTQQLVQSFERDLQNTEKLLWLEKERSATLENEARQLHRELNALRSTNEELKHKLEAATTREAEETNSGEGLEPSPPSADQLQQGRRAPLTDRERVAIEERCEREIEKARKEIDIRVQDVLDLKAKVEWRLGEMTQNYHDAKWRVGELEAIVAHKEYEHDQLMDRIKQLESVLATPVNSMSGEIQRLEGELARLRDEKSKSDWHLGEYKQWFNDAKWRAGSLEADLRTRTQQLDEAHLRIGGLERRVWELESVADQNGCQLRDLHEKIDHLPNPSLIPTLKEGFILAKQPDHNRHRWQNSVTWENMCGAHPRELRRVWFETDVDAVTKDIFLIGSFVNWEIAILMKLVHEDCGRKKMGIWIQLPLGRHEFRFVTDGEWKAMPNYPQITNEFGEPNNCMQVK